MSTLMGAVVANGSNLLENVGRMPYVQTPNLECDRIIRRLRCIVPCLTWSWVKLVSFW